jgi:hypothetical protein
LDGEAFLEFMAGDVEKFYRRTLGVSFVAGLQTFPQISPITIRACQMPLRVNNNSLPPSTRRSSSIQGCA